MKKTVMIIKKEMQQLYGTRGVHYALELQPTAIR